MASMKEIRQKCRKRYSSFHRRILHEISFFLTKFFLYLPFTPNELTVFWVVFQLLASLVLLKGTYLYMVLGVLLFHFGTLLDCVDGQVARFRKQTSISGDYLDNIAHFITNPFFIACFTIGVWRLYNDTVYLWFGLVAILSFWNSRLITVNPLWFPPEHRQLVIKAFPSYEARGKMAFLFDSLKIEYPFNVLFFGVLLGFANWMLILYSLMFFFDFIRRAIVQFTKIREIERKR